MSISISNSCLICGRKSDLLLNNSTNKICVKFKTLVSRFFKLESSLNISTLNDVGDDDGCKTEESDCCFSCLPLVESFCSTHKKWECLQLELFHIAENISKLMMTCSPNEFRKEFNSKVEAEIQRHGLFVRLEKINDSEIQDKIGRAHKIKSEIAIADYDQTENEHSAGLPENNDHDHVLESIFADAEDNQDAYSCADIAIPADDYDDETEAELQTVCGNDNDNSQAMNEDIFTEFISNDNPNPEETKVETNNLQEEKQKSGTTTGTICDICGKLVPEIGRHRRENHGVKRFVCDFCGQACISRYRLKQHQKCHSDSRNFTCELCGITLKYQSNLRRHRKKIHNIVDPIPKRTNHSLILTKCFICHKTFKNPSLLEYHIRVYHTLEKPFQCPVCLKEFSHTTFLKKHQNLYQHYPGGSINENYAGVKCNICDKVVIDVVEHRRKVHRVFKRDGLQQNVSTDLIDRQTLNQLRNSDGLKKDVCDLCGKAFANKFRLQVHQISHSEIRNFKCEICEQTYKYRLDLKRHKKRFHNIIEPTARRGVPYGRKRHPLMLRKCLICNKTFQMACLLESHIRGRHIYEKPFHCRVCLKEFPSKALLKKHRKLGHEWETEGNETSVGVKCDICDKVVKDIEGHRRRNHPECFWDSS